ncbi:MAG: hypothetical protein VYC63_00870 [Verrucomicrobiota bacterium]|nr:hypothetical protein [Verrucomicrobiota bacterium]
MRVLTDVRYCWNDSISFFDLQLSWSDPKEMLSWRSNGRVSFSPHAAMDVRILDKF